MKNTGFEEREGKKNQNYICVCLYTCEDRLLADRVKHFAMKTKVFSKKQKIQSMFTFCGID